MTRRYGSVTRRGLCRRVREQAAEAETTRRDREASYVVPAGTGCWVRRRGGAEWRSHRTRADVRCVGFLWRNEGWYGLAWGEWELKVRVGDFRKEKASP